MMADPDFEAAKAELAAALDARLEAFRQEIHDEIVLIFRSPEFNFAAIAEYVWGRPVGDDDRGRYPANDVLNEMSWRVLSAVEKLDALTAKLDAPKGE